MRLSTAGRELTQPLVVHKDPHSAGTEADIQAQMTMLFALRRDIERGVEVVNQIEHVRGQIDGLARVIDDAAIEKAADELSEKLITLEENLLEVRLTGPGAVRGAAPRLMSKMLYWARQLSSADFQPTDPQLEVQGLLEDRPRSTRGGSTRFAHATWPRSTSCCGSAAFRTSSCLRSRRPAQDGRTSSPTCLSSRE